MPKELKVEGRWLISMILILMAGAWTGADKLHCAYKPQNRMQGSAQRPPSTSSSEDNEDLIGHDLRSKRAPAFTLRDLRGRKISLSQYRGHATVIQFWSMECEPCMLEMPRLAKLAKEYRSQGLVVLGINQDGGAAAKAVAGAAMRAGVHYPILFADRRIARHYGGVEYLPETFYVTRSGNILLQTVGEVSCDRLETNILRTLASGRGMTSISTPQSHGDIGAAHKGRGGA